ncbi:MAG TPA: hypothetical protein PK760_13810, partial [Flavobacteriales bacterium]|nr:hypothetical protein [Flavobacteriales bacterium]
MTSHRFAFLALALPFVASVAAQPERTQPIKAGCHYLHNRGVHRELTSAERSQIDETIARSDTFNISHYDISLDVTDYNGHLLKGATTVTFQALMAGQNFIRFDLYQL